jgi:2,5-dihydroxypyridine 5,6-dioxygenase
MIRLPISLDAAADLVRLFREGLKRSNMRASEAVVIYGDTFTNPVYMAAFLAAARDLGTQALQIVQPLVPADLSKPIGRAEPSPLIIEAMKQADFVVDLSTGGMLYSNEQLAIQATGTRILRVREPEDILLRLLPSDEVRERAIRGVARYNKSRKIRLSSAHGTDLTMDRGDRAASNQYGMADEPGRWDHWGTGLVTTTVLEDTVEGTLVISPAAVLFPFELYVTEPVRLRFESGSAVAIEGGREATMLREFIEHQGDTGARRLSHIGWGVEKRGRWETLAMRGWDNGGGVETRSTYGCVLLALGENRDLGGENASRLHIDIALRTGRLELDGEPVVDSGRFIDNALG